MSARTGERVTIPEGGFNPAFQRHVAAYARVAEVLPRGGRVLDLACEPLEHCLDLLAVCRVA